MVERLLEQKVEKNLDEEIDSDVDKLVVKLLSEKFNKKYLSSLNKQQAQLLEARLSGNVDGIIEHVDDIKKRAIQSLEKFYQTCDNKVLHEKRKIIESKIKSLSPNTTDDTIAKALTISALVGEMEDENE